MTLPAPVQPPTRTRQRGNLRPGPDRVSAQVKFLAQTYGADAIEALATIMLNPESRARDVIVAARELLDRGFGKPKQQISAELEAPGCEPRTIIDWNGLPKDTLRAILDAADKGLKVEEARESAEFHDTDDEESDDEE